jgi:sarcosine oxidase, subunit gamma
VIGAVFSDVDVANEAFPFMTWRDTSLDGVPVRVARISFSGELAFEVNVNAWYAPAMWERLMAAGRPYGITPYGTETMDVLRAEKGYPIVGQDTDGTVTPHDLGMAWAVSNKKPGFIDKRSFSRSENQNPLRKQLVELRLDPSGPGAAAVAELLGVELPTKVSTYAKSADTTVIWLGPDEWLVTDTALTGPELEARLRAAVTPHGGAAVDVSGQRTNLRLRGSHSRDVLAKGCALDLHPRVFGACAAAESMLGRAGVILLAVDGRGGDYRILVCPSFARYLADWLLDAVAEYAPGEP